MDDKDFVGFWGWATRRPDVVALVEADSGRQASFGALAAASNQVAHGLRAEGLGLADGVAMLGPNCIESMEAFLGAMQTGLYFTLLNTYLAPPELGYVLDNCEARVLIIHPRFRALALAAFAHSKFPAARCLWIGDEPGPGGRFYEGFKSAQPATPPKNRVAGQVMIYSSGTTGKPKGIRPALPKAGPDSFEAARGFSAQLFGLVQGQGVHLLNGPAHHSGPMTFVTIALYYGHTVVMMDKWDAELALRLIETYRVTNTFMVPTMFTRILKLPEPVRRKYDLSSLTVLIHAAAPCPVPVKHAMIEWLGPILFESYGGTEGAGTTVNSHQWLTKPGTVGPPAPNMVVKILDDEGNERPPREVGTVYLTPSFGLPEYFKDPGKSAEVRRGGMFTIGDIGYLDEDGWLFLVDRKSDMLISGGVNIYPAEIELALLKHPKILDVAVIGVPSEDWGEEVKAIVQLDEGVTPSRELAHDIIEFSQTLLARYKVPRSVDFIAKLPRAENGKLYKRELRNTYWAGKQTLI